MKTVILAAGFGSRLWPLSTSEKPKQFQPLINGQSLLRYTYTLLNKVIPADELYVLTLHGLEHHVVAELPDIAESHVIAVPERRNTLPHTLWALDALGADPDEPILFKSVDHYVLHPGAFLESLQTAIADLSRQPLSAMTLLCNTFQRFDKNDGYVLVDADRHVKEFMEKPSEAKLRELQTQGTVYRSPFVYACSKAVCLDALRQLKTPLADQAARLLEAPASEQTQVFLAMPTADISSALFQARIPMRVEVINYDFIDVGRFATLYELNPKDKGGNVCSGSVILAGSCRNNFIVNQLLQPLVVTNMSDMVIVQTPAGSLVAPMQDADMVGEVYKTQIYQH